MLSKDQLRRELTTMHYPVPEVRQPHGCDHLIIVWSGEVRNGSQHSLHRLCDGLKEHAFAKLHKHGYQLLEAKIITGEPCVYPSVQWTITFKVSPS